MPTQQDRLSCNSAGGAESGVTPEGSNKQIRVVPVSVGGTKSIIRSAVQKYARQQSCELQDIVDADVHECCCRRSHGWRMALICLHDRTFAAFLCFRWLDRVCNSCRFRECLIDTSVPHRRAFCVRISISHRYPGLDRYIPRYLRAPICFATSRPSLYWISCGPSASSFSCSSLRSHFNAQRTILTSGQCSLISASHFVDTFSREPRLSTCTCKCVARLQWV